MKSGSRQSGSSVIGSSARNFVTAANGAVNKIPRGSILNTPRGEMVVERSNGYVISGRERGSVNRVLSIDLRNEDAEFMRLGGDFWSDEL